MGTINAANGTWTLQGKVVGFHLIHGTHTGNNLGCYFIGLCDRVGIMSHSYSKLYTVTLDNTSLNNTFCDTVKSQHRHRQLPLWCLEHVVNLANVDIMSHITKLAVIETTNAIWEYDPSDLHNRVLGGGLDVIATIRMLAVKMEEYSTTSLQPQPPSPASPTSSIGLPEPFLSEFNWHQLQLLSQGSNEEWWLELWQYLQDVPADVTRDTDIIHWWLNYSKTTICFTCLTISVAASSLPPYLTTVFPVHYQHARLKAEVFEELQVLKATWHCQTVDLAQQNSEDAEEVLDEFEDLCLADEEMRQWDKLDSDSEGFGHYN
ncbi:hypothetical protein EDB85DRAFT_2146864 [Lactarius pseudohatsudake]|nr:hypothetical protein EDB85DRAFT_2146864 [Lactarius pseudohatsudake]